MTNDIFVEMEYHQYIKYGQAACGDDIQLQRLDEENRHLAVLSDGLGSGIKANILANMTTTMALCFLRNNLDLLQSVEIMMDSLPICEVRKISYATFSMVDLRVGGITKIVEMGNPRYIHLRGELEVEAIRHKTLVSTHWPDREVECYEALLVPGDRLIVCSDGITQSGIGQNKNYKFGWRREGELAFAQNLVHDRPGISARELACAIAYNALDISENHCKDDISCLVIYLRKPRVLRILTGPPFYKENDEEFARQVSLGPDHTIICGGTTAKILERILGKTVIFDRKLFRCGSELPPPGEMPGIGLVTEGILTLSRVCCALENEETDNLPLAAEMIIDRIQEHDRIEFILGTKVNEAHQDPSLPEELGLRRGIVQRMRQILETKYRKTVIINRY